MVDLKPGARLKLPADSIGALVVVRGELDSAVGELTAGDFLDLSVEPTDWVSAGLGGARLLAVSDGEWPPASVFAPLLRMGRRLRRR